jgi:hypothetical protein
MLRTSIKWLGAVYFGIELIGGHSNYIPDVPELVHFRNRIGADGFNLIFKMSVGLHGKQAQESTVLIDTTVQERNITYPTDAKTTRSSERFSSCLRISKLIGFEGLPLSRQECLEKAVSKIDQLMVLASFIKGSLVKPTKNIDK